MRAPSTPPERAASEGAAPTPLALRAALGRYATGVTVVTCRAADGQPAGLTVNSFAALSLEPPLVLWSLRRVSHLVPVFDAAKHFGVSVLAHEHEAVSRRFASPEADKFALGHWQDGLDRMPLLADALARFECRLQARHEHGDHVLYIGRVLRLAERAGAPLVFHAGQYRAIDGLV